MPLRPGSVLRLVRVIGLGLGLGFLRAWVGASVRASVRARVRVSMPRRGVCDEGRHAVPVTELVERGGWRHGVGKARLVSEHVAHCDAALAPRAESGPVQRHRVV